MSTQHSEFPGPHCHIGEGITDYLLDTPICAAYAVIGSASQNAFGLELNHWRLFLAIDHNSSIVFDMVKTTSQDPRGVLGILSKPYAVTNTAIKVVNLPLGSSTVTARKLWESLHREGCLKYSYSLSGEGCRAWVANTVRVWES